MEYQFELENAKVKKTALLLYKCKYWLINKHIYTYKILQSCYIQAMNHWNTESLEKNEPLEIEK